MFYVKCFCPSTTISSLPLSTSRLSPQPSVFHGHLFALLRLMVIPRYHLPCHCSSLLACGIQYPLATLRQRLTFSSFTIFVAIIILKEMTVHVLSVKEILPLYFALLPVSELLPVNPVELLSLERAQKCRPDSAWLLAEVHVGTVVALDAHLLRQSSNAHRSIKTALFKFLTVDSTPLVPRIALSLTVCFQFILSLLTHAAYS